MPFSRLKIDWKTFQTAFVHAKRLLRLKAAVHTQNVFSGEAGFVGQQPHNRVFRFVRVAPSATPLIRMFSAA